MKRAVILLVAAAAATAQAKMEAAFGIGNSRYDGIVRTEAHDGLILIFR